MKRLILMGGRPWVTGDKGKSFSETLFRYQKESINIAYCIFAQPEEEWAATTEWNTKMFNSFGKNRLLKYKTITRENFKDVSRWADIIYLPGGDPYQLAKALDNYDLATVWDGKVIAGSSAGADLFCKKYIYLQDKTVGNGLGWIDAMCIPHWRDDFGGYSEDDWDWAENTAMEQGHVALCIPEGRFVEYTVR